LFNEHRGKCTNIELVSKARNPVAMFQRLGIKGEEVIWKESKRNAMADVSCLNQKRLYGLKVLVRRQA
jgi:hypothetical protein